MKLCRARTFYDASEANGGFLRSTAYEGVAGASTNQYFNDKKSLEYPIQNAHKFCKERHAKVRLVISRNPVKLPMRVAFCYHESAPISSKRSVCEQALDVTATASYSDVEAVFCLLCSSLLKRSLNSAVLAQQTGPR